MGIPEQVADLLGLRGARVSVLKDQPLANGSWLAGTLVLRRYHERATLEDVAYEQSVLRYLDDAGWVVPAAVSPVVQVEDRLWCLTRYVPGEPASADDPRRGRDLAQLHLTMRDLCLGQRLGQRPGWRVQHTGPTVHTGIDWLTNVRALSSMSPRLGSLAARVAADAASALAAVGADALPLQVVHGDFTSWNVHYSEGGLSGVIDFGLTHLDSRPYELAIARTYRSPAVLASYRAELAALGWPLSELEEAAIGPVYRAFRVDMAVWLMETGRVSGTWNLAGIERQLALSQLGPRPLP
jgi:Ser/Thr protein kinase RdoA (MazF antagonist)